MPKRLLAALALTLALALPLTAVAAEGSTRYKATFFDVFDTYSEIIIYAQDEAAAQADIRQERQAEQILRRAANALQAVQNESNSFQGETAAAIGERAEQLRRQILNLISDLEDTQNYTQRVVRRYWLLDQKWKQIFESSR